MAVYYPKLSTEYGVGVEAGMVLNRQESSLKDSHLLNTLNLEMAHLPICLKLQLEYLTIRLRRRVNMLRNLRIDGCITFWTLSEKTSRAKLEESFTSMSFENFIPKLRTPQSALKAMLESCSWIASSGAKVSYLVRALAGNNGFHVIEEHQGDDRNSYTAQFAVKLVYPECVKLEFIDTSLSDTLKQEMFHRYLGFRNIIPADNVARSLVNILSYLGATSLRPSGALYWVPDSSREVWKWVSNAVQDASDDANHVYEMSTAMDEAAIRAISDAVRNEISTDAAKIEQEMLDGELGKRAIESRKKYASELRKKIESYSGMLGVTFTSLTESLEKVEMGLAGLTLYAASA